MPVYREIDNRNINCPQPVINTKAALEEMHRESLKNFTLVSIVDNESAAENVTRFVRRAGYTVEVEKKDSEYHICIYHDAGTEEDAAELEPGEIKAEVESTSEEEFTAGKDGGVLLLVTSSVLGTGSEELGHLLMRNYFYALAHSHFVPDRIIFINSGVYLTTRSSQALEYIKQLEQKGAEVFSCGACLDYFELENEVGAGKVTNMYDIVEIMEQASRCITL